MEIRIVCANLCFPLRQLSGTTNESQYEEYERKELKKRCAPPLYFTSPNFLNSSSWISVVSTSVSHHCSCSLRSSQTADNSHSFQHTRIMPDVSSLAGSRLALAALALPLQPKSPSEATIPQSPKNWSCVGCHSPSMTAPAAPSWHLANRSRAGSAGQQSGQWGCSGELEWAQQRYLLVKVRGFGRKVHVVFHGTGLFGVY